MFCLRGGEVTVESYTTPIKKKGKDGRRKRRMSVVKRDVEVPRAKDVNKNYFTS